MIAMGAVVLAAGSSQRMGRPKMTLPWGGTTVIGQVTSVLLEAGLKDVLVVTGGARDEVEGALADTPVCTIFNPRYANGEMMLTLQVGLAAIKDHIEAVLVVLGDQPQIELGVVKAVMTSFEQGEHKLVIPSYQRRRGHPWLMARPLWDVLLALQAPATMRRFLDRHTGEIHYVNVNTPSILQDLDTPEDYKHFQSA